MLAFLYSKVEQRLSSPKPYFSYILKMKFDWDSDKAESNLRKHGISFNDAVTLFADPLLMFTLDVAHSGEELREWAIGETELGYIVVVVFAVRGETIRIISARQATKREREGYESGI